MRTALLPFSSHRRAALLAGALGTTALAATAPGAAAAPVVTVRTASTYAVIGVPVKVTVTSSETGTVQLAQKRPNRTVGPGRCGDYSQRYVGTPRPIAAGQTLTISLAPATLAYGGGDLFPPYGWNNPNYPPYQDLCYDRYSTFNLLQAVVTAGTEITTASTKLQRVL